MDEVEAPGTGRLVVISGPSGVGKGTVVDALRERRPSLRVSVSATTRPRRPHEVHGEHYFFLSREQFDGLVAADGFLEWAEFNGNRYGTPLQAVLDALAEGHTVLLEIEVQGALQVRDRVPDALLVFLMPPDAGELARRLHGRGTESSDEIADRLSIADQEMALAQALRGDVFDHVVVNRVVGEAAEEILRILDGPSATPA
ncbi:MAG TPA: guanylate kinase [Egibacteraceae bacterium]|nr:guanylate kinase [Egibacteraceae bacterium]